MANVGRIHLPSMIYHPSFTTKCSGYSLQITRLFLHVPKSCVILTKAAAALAQDSWDLEKFSQDLVWLNVHFIKSPGLLLFATVRDIVGSQGKVLSPKKLGSRNFIY